MQTDRDYMRLALRLARRGYGYTTPNPMVGAVLVRRGRIIGRGWHRRAGEDHAEIACLKDAEARGESPRNATLYVTLEPCSTFGRTPPCVHAIQKAGIGKVIVGGADPNPKHAGAGLEQLRQSGVQVATGVLPEETAELNEAFNHWITKKRPFVLLKAAMTLDGKIATAQGESKWITGPAARALAMRLRRGADAILAGVNTILADDPALTVRAPRGKSWPEKPVWRRIILDRLARTPLRAQVVSDVYAPLTTIVTGQEAPARRLDKLRKLVEVWSVPTVNGRLDLLPLLDRLGERHLTSLIVEGGGEVQASFVEQRLVNRVYLFYAPKIVGGHKARRAVGGHGAGQWNEIGSLEHCRWRAVGTDLMLTGLVNPTS